MNLTAERSAQIKFQAVRKSFPRPSGGGQDVVSTTDLTVSAGEFVSIVGPSGCGKSTLLRLMAGLEMPTAGTITIAGQPPQKSTAKSFVFQEPNLLPWRSALSNVALPFELSSISRAERIKRASQSLRDVDFHEDDFHKRPHMLSGGMKMRVSVARALVTEPDILLLDEPFAALDDFLRCQLNVDLQRRWMSRKFTALFVTHNIQEAVFLSSRILVMRPGRIVGDFPVSLSLPRDWKSKFEPEFRDTVQQVEQQLSEEAT